MLRMLVRSLLGKETTLDAAKRANTLRSSGTAQKRAALLVPYMDAHFREVVMVRLGSTPVTRHKPFHILNTELDSE